MRLRDEMYFEPRVVCEKGTIAWYNEEYGNDELLKHIGTTVYVRDNSKKLYIYVLEKDEDTVAVMKNITIIDKYTTNHYYGFTFGGIDVKREQELLDKIKQCKIDIQSTSSNLRLNDLNKHLRKLTKELKRVRRNEKKIV